MRTTPKLHGLASIAFVALIALVTISSVTAQAPDDLAALNAQVVKLYDQGKYAEATEIAKKSLDLAEVRFGPAHPYVGKSLNDLADLYRAQSSYAEALPLYKRSLAIRENALGREQSEVLTTLSNLSDAYAMLGRFGEAEPILKRRLALTEKALGAEHPDVATSLNDLALVYQSQGRDVEAEALYKRSLALIEKALGPEHAEVATALDYLAELYRHRDQDGEAETERLFRRSLALREKALGAEHSEVAISLDNLAKLYSAQDRFGEAEALYKRSLAITEKALGPAHYDLVAPLKSLAEFYQRQSRYSEAEPFLRRILVVCEKALSPEHEFVSQTLDSLASVAIFQRDWAGASSYLQTSKTLLLRRHERGLVGRADKAGKSDAEHSRSFDGLVKVTHRLAAAGSDEALRRASEMFETAQWGSGSQAATSLAQLAARLTADSPEMTALVRERQDRAAEWSDKNGKLIAARNKVPAVRQNLTTGRSAKHNVLIGEQSEQLSKRNFGWESGLADRLSAIDARLEAIDARLAKDFPNYWALVGPRPVSVVEVQSSLRGDEALVLFLDTAQYELLPEETFVWVVTKSEVRWLHTDLGTWNLLQEVGALRCGLDATAWWERDSPCEELTGITHTPEEHEAGKPLPFDTARAHALYRSLLGEATDLIKGKNLIIVPSGALTTLPFQVLVRSLPSGVAPGVAYRQIGRLGASFDQLSRAEMESLPFSKEGGVKVTALEVPGPAAAAGLLAGDILLAVDQHKFTTESQAIGAIQVAGPGRAVVLRIVRDGRYLELPVVLGALNVKVEDWKRRFLDEINAKETAWLIRDHAITVMPSVASFALFRRTPKPSAATRPMIGFGNPLLDGDQKDPTNGGWYKQQAQRARAETGCAATPKQRTAALRAMSRSAAPIPQPQGLADLVHLRMQVPLPETADELCQVARSLGADVNDMRIGAKATETEIKKLSASRDLAKYRIVHFATHGLLAGQLNGTREPGLILSPPKAATLEDDGYLSASEIASLKLDADWVILSACNTAGGAGDGEAAEALSGLARVFFYAGARALLVSHWEVDSQAAVKLVTGAVSALAKDASIGRAGALRRTILAAMSDTTRPADWVPAWHPSVWAPFVVVGEGGAGR